MKCPVDGNALVISERSGVEIDYCPSCRGVWLDRGELDKIIIRSDHVPAPPPGRDGDRRRDDRDRYDDRDYYSDDDDRYGDRGRGKRRKRESFLSDLFDFG